MKAPKEKKTMKFLTKNNLWFAWVVALCAMFGSLYFSQIKGFIPCEWCWYQRILMYPLTIILGIAAFKRDYNIVKYILPLSILGTLFGTLHYLEQKVGLMSMLFGNTCKAGIPCSGMYINWFGFITIPFLSLTAFILITYLLLLNKKGNK